MLVLTRKRNEVVRATVPGHLTKSGEPITIDVTLVSGHRAQIGFDAPEEVQLDRLELLQEERA